MQSAVAWERDLNAALKEQESASTRPMHSQESFTLYAPDDPRGKARTTQGS